jgi:hypothetical protein
MITLVRPYCSRTSTEVALELARRRKSEPHRPDGHLRHPGRDSPALDRDPAAETSEKPAAAESGTKPESNKEAPKN